MYQRVMDAIIKRSDRHGISYVNDYGSSIHKTAHLPYEVTVSIINGLEMEGKIKVIRTQLGTPIKISVNTL